MGRTQAINSFEPTGVQQLNMRCLSGSGNCKKQRSVCIAAYYNQQNLDLKLATRALCNHSITERDGQ